MLHISHFESANNIKVRLALLVLCGKNIEINLKFKKKVNISLEKMRRKRIVIVFVKISLLLSHKIIGV